MARDYSMLIGAAAGGIFAAVLLTACAILFLLPETAVRNAAGGILIAIICGISLRAGRAREPRPEGDRVTLGFLLAVTVAAVLMALSGAGALIVVTFDLRTYVVMVVAWAGAVIAEVRAILRAD